MCLRLAIERPDDLLSKGEHLGFEWSTMHNGMGYRCGYVRVPLGHPWHGRDYDLDVECHGGITYAEADKPCSNPGPDNAWWLGFDCAHGGDAPDPELRATESGGNLLFSVSRAWCAEVRSQEYVEAKCRRLCEQAAEAAGVLLP